MFMFFAVMPAYVPCDPESGLEGRGVPDPGSGGRLGGWVDGCES